MKKNLKLGLHVHSWMSADTSWTKEEFIELYKKVSFDILAITDHNRIDGALELSKEKDFQIIVGEEIMTKDGEVIGLFLKEEIKPNLSFEETIKQIHQQKGLVCLPHPFDRLRSSRLDCQVIEKNIKTFDLVEIGNSRTLMRADDEKAKRFAQDNNITSVVGSDAHMPHEVELAYMEISNFDDPKSFLQSVRKGKISIKYSSFWAHLQTKIIKTFR